MVFLVLLANFPLFKAINSCFFFSCSLKYYVESLNESSEKDIQAVITLSEVSNVNR